MGVGTSVGVWNVSGVAHQLGGWHNPGRCLTLVLTWLMAGRGVIIKGGI